MLNNLLTLISRTRVSTHFKIFLNRSSLVFQILSRIPKATTPCYCKSKDMQTEKNFVMYQLFSKEISKLIITIM